MNEDAERDRVRAIAAEAMRVHARFIREIDKARDGFTNSSWMVSTAQRTIVVRINSPHTHELAVDRSSELRVLQVAAQAGLGPRVLVADPQAGVLVTELLAGSPWSAEYARTPAGIARLAELLRQVHALSPVDGIRQIDFAQLIDHYTSVLTRHGVSDLPDVGQRARALQAASVLRATQRLRLCHNDVHHLNLMDDGRLRLLDWEYAGMGDPYFDLAGVCCYHSYSEGQREQLLQHYLPRSTATDAVRLEMACSLFEYVSDLWFAVRNVTSTC